MWDGELDDISEHYRVITLDLPGFGKSGINREVWSINQFGDDIILLIKELELENTVLVGHSMGGLVAVAAAAQSPENIKGLVIVDAIHDTKIISEDAKELAVKWFKASIKKGNVGAFNNIFQRPEFAERFNNMLPEEIPDFWFEKEGSIIYDILNWQNEEKTPALESIQQPIFLINGTDSETDVSSIKKYVKNLHVTVIPGTSHYPFWDKPDDFKKVLHENLETLIEQ